MKLSPLVALTGLVLSSIACSNDDAKPRDVVLGEVLGTSAIGPDGGRVSSPDGRITLFIEAGTFAEPVDVGIRRVESAPRVVAGPTAAFRPRDLGLAPAGRLEMVIDPADLAEAAISSTVMASWDAERRRWVPLPSQLTTRRDDGFYVRVAQLSQLGVVAAAVPRQQGDERQCTTDDACTADHQCPAAAPSCDGNVLVTPVAWCVDCACASQTVRADCAAGGRICQDGACVAPSCLGVVCNAPPEPTCEENVAISYAAVGACIDGTCEYAKQTRDCVRQDAVCVRGHCLPIELCNDGVDNDFDGQRDCGDRDCANDDFCRDDCPSDPAKKRPGVCGCGVLDLDTDGDDTFDCDETCIRDPFKTEPGQCGCGVADRDSDSDTILDCHDGCPSVAGKVSPGVCGCAVADTDSDLDGTPNCVDACPADPAKIAAGACGCGVADTNSDGDARPNCQDACPLDPNKIAVGQCGCGVADQDPDGDGVASCNDQCPADASKTAPGECGCGTPDVDEDGDGYLVCDEQCDDDPNKTAVGLCGCGFVDDEDRNGEVDCELCADAVDNDDNGLVDCADAFCHGRTGCETHLFCLNCAGDPPLIVVGSLLAAPGAADIDVSSRVRYQLLASIAQGTTFSVRYTLQGGATFEHVFDDAHLTASAPIAARLTAGGKGATFATYQVQATSALAVGAHLDLSLAAGLVRLVSDSAAARTVELTVELFASNDAPMHTTGEHQDTYLWIAPAIETGECADNQDDDFDGSFDCDDQDCFFDDDCDVCPSDPGKWQPGVCGCGVADSNYDGDMQLDCNDDDDDSDGILDVADRCARGGLFGWQSSASNDYDNDGCHDNAEDLDDDNDGIVDTSDLCAHGRLAWTSTPLRDHDADGCRDATTEDLDDDNDGVFDTVDACNHGETAWISSATTDDDGDGCRDAGEDADDDDDGVLDFADSCPRGEILWTSSTASDYDGDGCRDDATEDGDDDNDGKADGADRCPKGSTGWATSSLTDHDSDGCKDNGEDLDDDDDTYLDTEELACNSAIRNAASIPVDTDADDICDAQDWDDDNDTFHDTEEIACGSLSLVATDVPPDHDADDTCDALDNDDDGDAVVDVSDRCPRGHTGWFSTGATDLDADGCDAVEDLDDDGDDWLDTEEVRCQTNPLSASSIPDDLDGDLTCDDADRDDDNDGLEDPRDPCPRIASNLDTDGDGKPDCADACPQDPNKTQTGYCGCGAPETCELCSDNIDNNANGLPDCVDDACAPTPACSVTQLCYLCSSPPPTDRTLVMTERFFSSSAYPRLPLEHELIYQVTTPVPAGSNLYVIWYFTYGGTWASSLGPSHLSVQSGGGTVNIDYVGGGYPGAYYVYWYMTVGGSGLAVGDKVVIDARDAAINLPFVPYQGLVRLYGYGYYAPPSYYYSWLWLGGQERNLFQIRPDAETSCTNATDDDFDGLVDCADASCALENSPCDQCPSHPGLINGVCGCAVPDDLDGDGAVSCVDDPDDDNDDVDDVDDACALGLTGWRSSVFTDPDGDGCLPEEDSDDDGDGFDDVLEVACNSDPSNAQAFPPDIDRRWALVGDTCKSCEQDCGTCEIALEGRCGDRVCDPARENCTNCWEDCGRCYASCNPTPGVDSCDAWESCTTCPQDCGSCSTCGDGRCNPVVEDAPDGVCNALDDDDDGDGHLDSDEISCGSNTADFLSTPVDPDDDDYCSVYDNDDDGDGLADGVDACPLEAAPHADADGDNTPDCIDLCPNDAFKTAPLSCGCNVDDDPSCELCDDRMDNDGDGMIDCDDSACFADARCADVRVVCYNCASDPPAEILDTALRAVPALEIEPNALMQYQLTRAVPAGGVLELTLRFGIGATFTYAMSPAHLSVVRQSNVAAADVVTLTSGGAPGANSAVFRVQLAASVGLVPGDSLQLDFGSSVGAAVSIPSAFVNFDTIRLFAYLRDGAGNLVDPAAADSAPLFSIYRACADGIDNDADGAVDCLDSDCDGFPTCEDSCADGRDDDVDGLADCNDPDCVGTTCASGTCNVLQSLEWNLGAALISWSTSNSPDYIATPATCSTKALKDHMFAWTAPATGQYSIDTTGSASDTVVWLKNGDCYGSTIACNDTRGSDQTGGVVVSLTAQQAVTIVVSAAGAYQLNITQLQQ